MQEPEISFQKFRNKTTIFLAISSFITLSLLRAGGPEFFMGDSWVAVMSSWILLCIMPIILLIFYILFIVKFHTYLKSSQLIKVKLCFKKIGGLMGFYWWLTLELLVLFFLIVSYFIDNQMCSGIMFGPLLSCGIIQYIFKNGLFSYLFLSLSLLIVCIPIIMFLTGIIFDWILLRKKKIVG